MEPDAPEAPASLAERAVAACERVAPKLEFESFLIGVKGDLDEDAKRALKRDVGLALEQRWPERRVAFRRPDVVFIYDPAKDWVEPTVRSIYVYGRYRKLARNLTQTRTTWRCPVCRNKTRARVDCAPCHGTGRRFPDSVEELLAGPLAQAYASREFALHGLGREDTDVQCLGRGRPFVLELKRPRKRTVDLAAVRAQLADELVGRVELPAPLREVPGDLVPRLKGWVGDKAYRARCVATAPIELAQLGALQDLVETPIEQRTPARVSHRRVDKVRKRKVLSLALHAQPEPHVLVLDLTCQSGTYVKELVSGDEGRTQPSLSELLGVPCTCEQLDVLDVLVDCETLLGSEPPPPAIED
ncbi:MAG: tRNA pseudouridine(54/55) synthase Pus10 [Planctomycetota bacterium]